MPLVLKDRVQEVTNTTGTGTLTLAGAVNGFQSFSVIGNGNTTYYTISGNNQWEVGIGTYTASGTTLSRDTVLESSNSGNLVDFVAGSKTVFVTYPTARVVIGDGTSIQVANSATLPVSAGGTGSATATFSGANITSLNANNVSTGILAVGQGGTGSATAAFSGANITSINASNISSGTLDNARTSASSANGANTIVLRDASGDFAADIITATSFSGSGASLTSLNASAISSGTIANDRTTATHVNGASTIVSRDASGNFAGATITATTFSGSGASITSLNASNISAGTLAVARGGTGSGTTPTNGQLLIGNGSGFTLATITQGTGITVGTGAGSTTITNAGVTSATGTTNQITVSASTGAVTFSTPQSIATGSSVQFGSFGVGTAASGTTGEIRATNNITAYYSDDRLKTKLSGIESALEKLCSLSGFFYEANETAQALGYDPVREVGLSAQEVQKVLPEIVVPAPIDAQYLTIRYERLAPLIVEAIKELKAEVDELKRSK